MFIYDDMYIHIHTYIIIILFCTLLFWLYIICIMTYETHIISPEKVQNNSLYYSCWYYCCRFACLFVFRSWLWLCEVNGSMKIAIIKIIIIIFGRSQAMTNFFHAEGTGSEEKGLTEPGLEWGPHTPSHVWISFPEQVLAWMKIFSRSHETHKPCGNKQDSYCIKIPHVTSKV